LLPCGVKEPFLVNEITLHLASAHSQALLETATYVGRTYFNQSTLLLLLPLPPQGEELEPARAKAEQMGVQQIFIDDLREEFVRDYVFPMFRANSLYEGVYLLGTSIARWGAVGFSFHVPLMS
jgi:hypothetical protein